MKNKPHEAGFVGLVVILLIAIAASIVGAVVLNARSDTSKNTSQKLQSLTAQVNTLEKKAKSGNLSSGDINTIDNLQQSINSLDIKTSNLSGDTKAQLNEFTKSLDRLEADVNTPRPTGVQGVKGDKGDTGNTGATGASGSTGPSGTATCSYGNCLSLQAVSPGTQETGNINLSGIVKAGSFSGSGVNLTNVDASYLNGFNAGYFTSASNLSSGTLADTRLSINVPLLNAIQTFSSANTFSSAGNSFTGNGAGLTGVNAALLQGNNTGYFTNASNISSGTLSDTLLGTNVTLLGNTFNGASQLTKLDSSGSFPALSAVNLTSLNASNITSGTLANARLANSGSLTITSGTGLSGGGAVALGGSITLTNTGVLSVAGTPNQIIVDNSTGNATFSLPQSIAAASSPTFAGLTLTGNLGATGTITAGRYTRSCPTGYVPVPGNPQFGTTDFCVMKYDAKDDGSGNAVSTAAGAPWVNISQRTAEDKSIAAGGHLLTEAEWMTIATNALWVNANWCNTDGSTCGNAPGTAGKVLATGHQDNSPAQALAASSDDNQACYGTVTADTNTACGSAGTQKRTLTLSNGSVIWDIPGNVWEWTNAWILAADEPTVAGSDNSGSGNFAWREYTAINRRWGALSYANPTNRAWNSGQRLGQILSTDNTATTDSNYTQYGFLRGGVWGDGADAGAFALALNVVPTLTDTGFGFRVAR